MLISLICFAMYQTSRSWPIITHTGQPEPCSSVNAAKHTQQAENLTCFRCHFGIQAVYVLRPQQHVLHYTFHFLLPLLSNSFLIRTVSDSGLLWPCAFTCLFQVQRLQPCSFLQSQKRLLPSWDCPTVSMLLICFLCLFSQPPDQLHAVAQGTVSCCCDKWPRVVTVYDRNGCSQMVGQTDPTSMNLILVLLQNCSCTLQSMVLSCQHSSNNADSQCKCPICTALKPLKVCPKTKPQIPFKKLIIPHVKAIQQAP